MSELTTSSIKKLKVAELKTELSKRGLSTKGKKDELASRLLDAIEGLDRTVAEETEGVESEHDEADDSQIEEDSDPKDVNGAEEAEPAQVPLPDGDEEMGEETEKTEAEEGAKEEEQVETAEAESNELQNEGKL